MVRTKKSWEKRTYFEILRFQTYPSWKSTKVQFFIALNKYAYRLWQLTHNKEGCNTIFRLKGDILLHWSKMLCSKFQQACSSNLYSMWNIIASCCWVWAYCPNRRLPPVNDHFVEHQGWSLTKVLVLSKFFLCLSPLTFLVLTMVQGPKASMFKQWWIVFFF